MIYAFPPWEWAYYHDRAQLPKSQAGASVQEWDYARPCDTWPEEYRHPRAVRGLTGGRITTVEQIDTAIAIRQADLNFFLLYGYQPAIDELHSEIMELLKRRQRV